MSQKYSDDLLAYAFYGIEENIDVDETVKVSLRELLKVYATLAEFQKFFHQPMHYQSIEDLQEYLGTVDEPRAYRLLHTAVYESMQKMLPSEVHEMFDEGRFDAPYSPYYFKE